MASNFLVKSSSLRSVLVALPGSQVSLREVSVLWDSLLEVVCLCDSELMLSCELRSWSLLAYKVDAVRGAWN